MIREDNGGGDLGPEAPPRRESSWVPPDSGGSTPPETPPISTTPMETFGPTEGGGGEGGGGGGGTQPTPPPPTSTGGPMEMSTLAQPGNQLSMAAFRTPSFFTNRFVGGPRTMAKTRFGAGAPMAGSAPMGEMAAAGGPRKPAQMDEATLRALIAKFGGAFGRR